MVFSFLVCLPEASETMCRHVIFLVQLVSDPERVCYGAWSELVTAIQRYASLWLQYY